MKKIGLIALVAFGSASLAWGQSPEELLRFSRTDYSLSTARSAAMAGAFTSLGADAVSMSLNPAGLGMYSRSELTVSGALRITDSESRYGTEGNIERGNYTKPILNNLSFIYAFEDSGWRIGFGMNRLADFSGRSQVTGSYGTESMAYIFRDQLQGIPSGNLDPGDFPYLKYSPQLWNSILAYNTWLVNPYFDDPKNKDYTVSPTLKWGDQVASRLTTVTNGAVDEFALSTGYNLNGILFFGATLGMQNIFYRQNSYYEEFSDWDNNQGALDSFGLSDDLAMSGFGVNLKVGVTVRPLDWLRVGVAYHSPTWISMNELSVRDMDTWGDWGQGMESNYDFTADFVQDYQNQTPSKLMAGISATIARRVIVSVDYEAAWYEGMYHTTSMNWSSYRSAVAPTDVDNNPIIVGDYTNNRDQIDMNGMISDLYRQTNTVRVGVEGQPVDGLFLRAGFAYSDSPYASRESVYAPGTTLSDYGALTQWSGGLGYRRDSWGVDLAYVYSHRSSLPSVFYDYVANHNHLDIKAGDTLAPFENNYIDWTSHNILLTFSWRF